MPLIWFNQQAEFLSQKLPYLLENRRTEEQAIVLMQLVNLNLPRDDANVEYVIEALF